MRCSITSRIAFASCGLFLILTAGAKGNVTSASSALKESVEQIDKISAEYNRSPVGKARIDALLAGYQKFMGRNLSAGERDFMSKEIAGVGAMPRFDMNHNQVQISRLNGKTKELLVTIDVVNADKNLFRYNGKTFKLDPLKPVSDNLQVIIQGLADSGTASN